MITISNNAIPSPCLHPAANQVELCCMHSCQQNLDCHSNQVTPTISKLSPALLTHMVRRHIQTQWHWCVCDECAVWGPCVPASSQKSGVPALEGSSYDRWKAQTFLFFLLIYFLFDSPEGWHHESAPVLLLPFLLPGLCDTVAVWLLTDTQGKNRSCS